MQNRLITIQEQRSALQEQVEALRSAVETEKTLRRESVRTGMIRLRQRWLTCSAPQDAGVAQLEMLSGLKKEYMQLETELAAYGACDPVKMEEK